MRPDFAFIALAAPVVISAKVCSLISHVFALVLKASLFLSVLTIDTELHVSPSELETCAIEATTFVETDSELIFVVFVTAIVVCIEFVLTVGGVTVV